MAQQQDLKGFILAIVIIGLTLVIGIYVAATMQDNFRTTGVSNNIVNETILTVTDDGINLAAASALAASCSSTAICVNTTGNYLISADNYTISSGCLLTYIGVEDTSGFNNSNWKCSYSYTFTNESTASTAGGTLVSALAGGSNWITILVVIGFAVIVLGMLSEGLGKAAGGGMAGPTGYTY